MRIKKLELVGFKSFKDRTVIHFDAGITGIVGPNGCGKSNIVDALIWVMGEQSAKHLRGASMEDVIFGGAEGYGPMHMAEVSLTLENDGGPFPAQYIKHSEIMVTRRLYRSGDSEYLINKEPARLRDIQEIFMDTGAGAKGFSIIEQGAIGKIITAKPEERRTLIEEAAGITKFKVRKRESQRKLVQTEQNLLRLNDIVTELKRQIDSLQRQAKKAERYREIKVRLEDLDLWVSSKKYLELQKDAHDAARIFEEAQTTEVSGRAELETLESELQVLKLQVLEREKAVGDFQERHQELQQTVQKKELELQQLRFEVEQAKRNEMRTGNEIGELSARKEVLERELETIETQLRDVQADAERLTAEFEAKNSAYQNIRTRIDEVDLNLTDKRRSLVATTQSANQVDARLHAIQMQHDDMRTREEEATQVLQELVLKKEEFEKNRNRASKELDGQKQMQLSIMQDVENFEANHKTLAEKVKATREESQMLKDELNEVASRLYGLEALHANFEGFQEGVKNVMLWQRSRIQQMHADGSVSESSEFLPVAEVVSVPAEYELAMEAALGTRLQTLISDKSDDSLGAVDYLKEQKLGRSSFLNADLRTTQAHYDSTPSGEGVVGVLKDLVSAPEKFQTAVGYMLDGVAVVDSIRTALRLRGEYAGWSYVTLEGDMLSHDGVLTGGTVESADSGVLKRRREMKELSQKKEEKAGKLALTQLSLQKLEEQLQGVETDMNKARKTSFEQEILVTEKKKDLERADMELTNVQRAFEKQQSEVNQINVQSTQLEEKVQELQESLAELTAAKMALEVEVAALDQELAEAKAGVGNLQEDSTRLRVESAEKRQESEGLNRQQMMLSNSLNDVNSKLSATEEESTRISQTLSENEIMLQEESVALDRAITELQGKQAEYSALKDAYEAAHEESRTLEEKVFEIRRTQNGMQSQMNEAQLKLEQCRMKADNLLLQIRERYMLDLMSVLEKYQDREGDLVAADAEIEELRDKLKRVGEVNLSAIEEYEEISKRYEFLSKQQEDLVNAKEELRKVIDRINRICTKRFKDTFEAVNERFTKAFPVLFGGGEAHLTLVENEDKSEMGIDIMARPPGKKLQSVSLLSGGEKALTAVALIFSIFLVKPSPFCLLDEVDAPLDDANVFRFNDLVKEMAKRSQIIVVTHNKHTMEINERLYGVTMQERGVSKMVSVSLTDAARLVATQA